MLKIRGVVFFLLSLISFVEANQRLSSAPYISGDSFRAYCDHIFDETGCNFNPRNVKDGATIFVKGDYLGEFFKNMHPQIPNRYILVSHNSDFDIPGIFASFLDDSKLIGWFGQNVLGCTHPKIHPIPIGLANRYWGHGNIDIVSQVIASLKGDRDTLLYFNINVGTNISVRRPVYQKFTNLPFCYNAPSRPFREYLIGLGHSKFVLSPRGNGLDCHRTWESLYMGAIPIVMSSDSDSMFEGLPVLIIHDWDEITEEFLQETYEKMQRQTYETEKLFVEYWFDYIDSFKTK